MTLNQAIEVLEEELTYPVPRADQDLTNALRLGIEALKLIPYHRRYPADPLPDLLPGETEDRTIDGRQ